MTQTADPNGHSHNWLQKAGEVQVYGLEGCRETVELAGYGRDIPGPPDAIKAALAKQYPDKVFALMKHGRRIWLVRRS